MNTSKQILLDKTVVKWVALLLNILVKIAGKIAPKNHDLSLPFRTIAVCKYKGLGSIIQSTPLLQTLRAQYPDAKIIFVTTSGNASFVKKINTIDEVITLEDKTPLKLLSGSFSFILKLFRSRIDVYIDLEVYSNFSSVVTALTNAQNRFGYYQKESNYRMGIYTHMMYYNSAAPIFQTYLQWARLLECRVLVTNLYRFHSVLGNIVIEEKLFDVQHEKYIVVNPNASDLRIERRWPASYFTQLIALWILQYPEYKILLIGAVGEREYVSSIILSFDKSKVFNIAGKTSIEQLITVLQHATLLITNDTGPMHIAYAMNIKTLSLFGPCSPVQYGYHTNTISLYKNVYCSPCVHEFRIPPCMGNNQCMQQISVQEVMNAASDLLAGKTEIYNENSAERTYSVNATIKEEVLGIIKRKSF